MALEISPKLREKVEDYAQFHTHRWNRVLHGLAMPPIVLGLLSLLARWELGQAWSLTSGFVRLDGGILLWAAVVAWISILDRRVAFLFSIAGLSLYIIGRTIEWPVALVLFLIGWVLQLAGHYFFEKNRPAFAKNAQHLLVGPVWLFIKATGLWDLSRKP